MVALVVGTGILLAIWGIGWLLMTVTERWPDACSYTALVTGLLAGAYLIGDLIINSRVEAWAWGVLVASLIVGVAASLTD